MMMVVGGGGWRDGGGAEKEWKKSLQSKIDQIDWSGDVLSLESALAQSKGEEKKRGRTAQWSELVAVWSKEADKVTRSVSSRP